MNYITQHGLFISQFFFSLLGVGFSIGMLAKGEDPSVYLPVLSGIIGVWIPSPISQQKFTASLPNNAPTDRHVAEVIISSS